MLRRFSDLLCSKCSFYSLIFAFIISLGCINTANAYVCFLPDSADCAQGDTEGFWPCAGNDCPSGGNGKCDASYNSRMSTNECGAACTRCSDSSSPYNGLYKCPENTCNCNEYTSTEAFNECGESCKVCRISGDKNYGKYKCPAVPEWGCNPQCEDYTLTAEDQCKDCDQCTNKNAPAEKQGLWKCTDCDRNIYTQPIAELTSAQIANHCYEDETCGCYMKCDNCFGKEFTMQDCINAGYNSAKNECNGKRGTVYETCCNTCNGYMYSTDLSKTSEGWSCTECPNSCEGGSKFSCGCKAGYHDDGKGSCVVDCQDTITFYNSQHEEFYVNKGLDAAACWSKGGNELHNTRPIWFIREFGGYSCNYHVKATGTIDDDFFIKNSEGVVRYDQNVEFKSEENGYHCGIVWPEYRPKKILGDTNKMELRDVNDELLFDLQAGEYVYVYVKDYGAGGIGWTGTITLQRY